jgi:hypothetical protein
MTMSPALAADNYRIIEATGATRTMAASDIGSVLYPRQLIQGLSGGVPTSVQMTTPGALNVNCVVGCSGGGAVTISGTLPAYASPPTFLLGGTLPAFGATPTFNIGTGSVGISGTLPAFASIPTVNANPFVPVAGATLASTTTSARVAFGAGTSAILINNGAVDVSFKLGNSGVVALTTDPVLPAGRAMEVAIGANTHVAGITAAGSSSLALITGTGTPNFSGGGSSGGGGGGAVTIANGADVSQGAVADLAATSGVGSFNVIQLLKGLLVAAQSTTPVDVLGPLTDTQLRATAVPISGTVTATGPLTDTQLRATPVPISGALTDTQLRASGVPVIGTGNVAHDSPDSGFPLKVGGVYKASPTNVADGDRADWRMSPNGNGAVVIGHATTSGFVNIGGPGRGVALSGNQALWATSFGMNFNGTSYDGLTKPATVSRIVSAAASTNATSAKVTTGDLHKITGYNAAAAVRYIKFYNKTSAPTVGTDVPILTIPVAPTAAFDIDFPNGGMYFSTGIAYAMTTGSADADTGALTAADILGLNVVYN